MMASGIKIARPSPGAVARFRANRRDAGIRQCALNPGQHDAGMNPVCVVDDKVGGGDHVLEAVFRCFRLEVGEHSGVGEGGGCVARF